MFKHFVGCLIYVLHFSYSAISEDEKAMLRRGLVCSFREPINQVATQLAVLISKIAR